MPRYFKCKTLTSVIVASTVSFAAPTAAQDSNQPIELGAIYACKSIADSMSRLNCYDEAVSSFKAAEEQGDVVTVSKSAIEKVERDAFGFNIPSLPSLGKLFGGGDNKRIKKNDLTEPVREAAISASPANDIKQPVISKPLPSEVTVVNLVVRKTTEFGREKTRFFMTNGQVWEQVGTTRTRIPKKKAGKDYIAEISKAAMGSFMMQVNGKGAAIRVRRVR